MSQRNLSLFYLHRRTHGYAVRLAYKALTSHGVSCERAMPSSFESIERDAAIVFALNRELRIVYCNEAWDRFAQSNGGTALMRPIPYGLCVLDVIPEPLKSRYRVAYLNVFATRRQWVHEYECSSSTVYRLFKMTALQRPEDDLILVANFLLEQRPHGAERPVMAPDPAAYEGSDHSVAMCSVCRKSRPRGGRRWHWVPAYVERPPARVVYGLCESCDRNW
jgi:hypothetical protein